MSTRSLFCSVLLAVGAALPAQPQFVSPLTPTRSAPPPRVTRGCAEMPGARELTEAEKAARQFRGPRVKGRRLARAINKLTRELKWHRKLEDAAAAAAEAGKPILWIQLLGDLRGRT